MIDITALRMDRVCDLLDFVSLRPRLTEVAAHHFPGSDLLVVPDPWYILFSASLRAMNTPSVIRRVPGLQARCS